MYHFVYPLYLFFLHTGPKKHVVSRGWYGVSGQLLFARRGLFCFLDFLAKMLRDVKPHSRGKTWHTRPSCLVAAGGLRHCPSHRQQYCSVNRTIFECMQGLFGSLISPKQEKGLSQTNVVQFFSKETPNLEPESDIQIRDPIVTR